MNKSIINSPRTYHIVQISRDAALFLGDRNDEPFQRQLEYGRILQSLAPGSSMSIIVLLPRGDVRPMNIENVTFIALVGQIAGRLRLWPELRSLHSKRPIDVITTQTIFDEAWIVLLFARLHRIRVVGQIHYDIFSPFVRAEFLGSGIFGRLRRHLGIKALRYFHTIRVVGSRIAEHIMEKRFNHNVHLLPVPVGLVRNVQRQEKIPRDRLVLFVGSLALQKNLEDWLQIAYLIAERVPDASFTIVGDGPLRARIEAIVGKLGLSGRVTLTGYLPNRDLQQFYSSAAVFLMTSNYEGFGRVLVEAYANRLPVVAYTCAGVEDIVDDRKTGYLHHHGATDAMAESVIHLLEHPDIAHRMGTLGHERVQKLFDPESLGKRWIELLIDSALPPLPHVIMPRRRTGQRWSKIAWAQYTILRSLQYEAIDGLRLYGQTLDVGGGMRNSYYQLIHFDGEIYSVNIDPTMRPSVVADLNKTMPFKSEEFDNIICFNTLEHINDDETAICESLRVLKPGGTFHILVPFLYRVHASPRDYHRRTLYWWIDYLKSLGANEQALKIEPLVWDRFSTAFSFIGHGPIELRLKRGVMLLAVIVDLGKRNSIRLPDVSKTRNLIDLALGYYIQGVK